MLEDPALGLLEPLVIVLEHALDGGEVVARVGALLPRQVGDELEVLARDVRVGSVGAHGLEARELALHVLARVLGEARLLELGAERRDVVVALAELLLDGLELLAQHDLFLALAQLAAHLRLDRLAELRARLGLADELDHRAQAPRDVELVQDLQADLVRRVDPHREAIREATRLGGLLEHLREGPIRRALLDEELAAQRLGEQARLGRVAVELRDRLRAHAQERLAADQLDRPQPDQPLHQEQDAAIAPLGLLPHAGEDAHGVEVVEGRLGDVRVLLDADGDQPIRRGRLREGARAAAPHRQGHHAAREHDAAAQREKRERLCEEVGGLVRGHLSVT